MTEQEMEMIARIDEIRNRPYRAEDLKPFLKDRTLLYGYTCDRKTLQMLICPLRRMTKAGKQKNITVLYWKTQQINMR